MNNPEQKKYTPKPMFKNPKRAFAIAMGSLILTFLLLDFFIFLPNAHRHTVEKFMDFDSTNIIGKISAKRHGPRSCSNFKINKENKEYSLYDCPQFELNYDNTLSSFASIGDSIIKLRHSDTLYLIKDGRKFEYTFDKFDPND